MMVVYRNNNKNLDGSKFCNESKKKSTLQLRPHKIWATWVEFQTNEGSSRFENHHYTYTRFVTLKSFEIHIQNNLEIWEFLSK